MLPDVYHLYKGGGDISGVSRIHGSFLGGFHLNDYPNIPVDQIQDKDRVYCGDGIAPLKQLFKDIWAIGYRGPMSIELFNPEYWKLDPQVVADTALHKTLAILDDALGANPK